MKKNGLLSNILTIAKTVAPAVVTKQVYDKMFSHHFYSYLPLTFSMQDFPNLNRTRYTFMSYSKKCLVGYIYRDGDLPVKGIFLFAHGYGNGGHINYLDLINSICKHGYAVFAYDATAYDESEGRTMKGFTQGMLDADRAISFIESLDIYKKMPLYLAGHSWGAYSVSTALGNHPRVKGLIAFSGFNSATTIFKENGEQYAGEKADEFMVYVDTYEKLLFGDICETTAVDSFKKSKAKIVIVHSQDDTTVPISAGFNIYKKAFKKDKRFKFIHLLVNGHGTVYYTLPGKAYHDNIQNGFKKYMKKQKPNEIQKVEFLNTAIDRRKYLSMVDEKLITKCINFVVKTKSKKYVY